MKKFCLLLLLGLFFNLSSANQFYFKKYQVEAGLSHNTVWCMLQDSYGFLWFGTSDGLNRFDGKRFKVYRNDIQDKFSLGNNSVQALFEDEDHNIWIGTNSGIYIYNRSKGLFTHFDKKTDYDVLVSSEVKKIIKTSKGQFWIATLGQGVFIYDPVSGNLKQTSEYTSFVWDICEDKAHRVYSSSLQEGLICYDQNGKKIESFTSFLDKKLENLKINCIYASDDKIWFSVGTNMLCLLDSKTKQIEYFTGSNLNVGTIRAITEFSENELLIGSDNGLYLFNKLNRQFLRVDNPMNPRSLSDKSIFAILKDGEGGLWIATYMGGVNYLASQTKGFEYHPPVFNSDLNTGKVISQFCETKDMNIWIASQDGLKLLNTKTMEEVSYVLPGKTKKLDIRSLLLDGDNLWIGTYSEGLKIINPENNTLEEHFHVRESTQTICSNDVLSLGKDKNGTIYVGTSWGLCRYNRDYNNFETLNFVGSMTSVSDILTDAKGYLWIATDNSGVFRFNPDNNQWKHYFHGEGSVNSITSNSIIKLFEDSNGRIWLGTNGAGLCYFNELSESFSDFDPENEILPNKVIYSIEEDNAGDFWISTNAGLLRINPDNTSVRKLFTMEYGLQSNQFNFKASLKSSTGKLYFGGINGFNAFYPNDIKENNYVPPVYIVDMRLYNIDENNNKKLLNLSEPVYVAKKATLPFDNNSVVFEFSALSYEDPDRNKYKYILEGFDKNWVNSENSNVASYTNLPPGEYVFRVKGSNNDNQWNEQGTSINVVVLPPWWSSMLAYILYFVCALIVAFFIYRYLAKRSTRRFHSQLEDYRVGKEKEMYLSKIRFFINLVHEIRTPLSLIKLPLEKLSEIHLDDGDSKTKKYLTMIDKNVSYLLNVVSQLLDFQKVENKEVRLNLKQQSLNTLLLDIYPLFEDATKLKDITLSFLLPDEDVVLPVDKDKVSKIVINVLSNAFKYANAKIDLRLERFDDCFKIRIDDDGPGVSDLEKDKVFEAFYQSNEDNSGTGIGLAFSKSLAESHKGTLTLADSKWGGSSFILSLPVTYSEKIQSAAKEVLDVLDVSEPDASASKRNTILLVEDNIELLNLIEEFLQPYFTVLKSENGKKALEVLSEENVDLIVSDVMMPEMNGLELSKAIKSDMNYSHIPVVLLTAKVTTDSKIEGLEYGADVYVEKPFSMRYLHKQIENLLKLKSSIQELVTTYPFPKSKDVMMSRKDKEFIEKLQVEIEKHMQEPDFSIDSIAGTMFMSRSSFYRKIKSISDMAPNDYLKMVRLNKAAELLIQGENIADVCDKVSFSSSSYFAKCFKAKFGVLPKDYVASIQTSLSEKS